MEKEKFSDLVVEEFTGLVEKKGVEPPLAAVQVVVDLMKKSEASTMMEFQLELVLFLFFVVFLFCVWFVLFSIHLKPFSQHYFDLSNRGKGSL